MMSSVEQGSPNNLAQPIRRTAEDWQQDRDTMLQNFANNALHDWPNEAGFENLTEHRGPIELPVRGSIPIWAAGSLFRNGPGAPGRKIGNVRSSSGCKDGVVVLDHWFDGLAHLHRFDIVPSDKPGEGAGAGAGAGANAGGAKVIYSSCSQSEEFIKTVQEKGSFGQVISFGQRADPCVGIFGKVMSVFKAVGDQTNEAMKYNNMNVTVQPGLQVASDIFKTPQGKRGHRQLVDHNNAKRSIWLASDTSGLRAVDPNTLAPIGVASQTDLHPSLKGAMSCAHAQRCPRTGDYFNYNIEAGPRTIYRIFRVSAATGKTDILATITNLPMAYIHSFFLSERFVVLRVPVSHIGKMGLSTVWKKNLVEAIEPFDRRKKCKWVVVDRVHGQGVVGEFETPAAFFFHSVNCWDELVQGEEGGGGGGETFAEVVCDVIDYPNTNVLAMMYFDFLKTDRAGLEGKTRDEDTVKGWFSSLVRWRFRVPLPTCRSNDSKVNKGKSLSESVSEPVLEIKAPHAGELPTINPHFHTRPYRYVYSLPNNGKSTFLDTIVKTDLITKEVLQWNNPAGHTPGEAIFVPRPRMEGEERDEEEDDGVLLSVVLDGFAESSYLVCIDARTMEEMGRADMDFAVGEGLHGLHTPAGSG